MLIFVTLDVLILRFHTIRNNCDDSIKSTSLAVAVQMALIIIAGNLQEFH